MKRLGEVYRGVAVTCRAHELCSVGSRKKELEPLCGERFVIGNQDSKRTILNH
jgi:hypothetical protein